MYNKILCGDCIQLMKQLPDKSVDMICSDPPYFMQLKKTLVRPDATPVHTVQDEWDQFKNFNAYDVFTQEWLKEAYRVLKDSGCLWVIGSYHNIFRVGYHLQNQGFWILNDIIWRKTNPMPNFKGRRFTNAHETLIWCVKNPHAKYTFHYESLKAFNEDLQMRSDWWLPVCHGMERVKNHNGKTLHPTQKPEALLYRILMATTNPDDVVLDPFMGTGTTCVVAKRLGRKWIGIEQDKSYIDFAQKRISLTEETDKSFLSSIVKPLPNKILFGDLVAQGIIKAGTILYSADKTVRAVVQSDGSLKYHRERGSIHQIAAKIKHSPSCNGWLFWFFEQKDQLKSIDILRESDTIKLSHKKRSQI